MMNTHKVYHKWNKNECVCQGHIVHGMMDALFEVLENVEMSRDLWEHLVSIAYKMVEDHSTMDHFNELCKVFEHCIHTEYNLWLKTESGKQGDKPSSKRSDKGTHGNVAGDAKDGCWRCGKKGHMKRDCRSKATMDKGAQGASTSGFGSNPGRGIISIPFHKNKNEMFEFLTLNFV